MYHSRRRSCQSFARSSPRSTSTPRASPGCDLPSGTSTWAPRILNPTVGFSSSLFYEIFDKCPASSPLPVDYLYVLLYFKTTRFHPLPSERESTMGASGSKQASRELVEACTTLDGIAEIASLFRKAVNGTSPRVREWVGLCVCACFTLRWYLEIYENWQKRPCTHDS